MNVTISCAYLCDGVDVYVRSYIRARHVLPKSAAARGRARKFTSVSLS